MELDENLYDQIVMLCDEGDALSEDGEVEQAIKRYLTALKLVPSPKNEWEASTWIYTALGDAYFTNEEYVQAKNSFFNALNCPDGISNPLILLRLGESLVESGELDKAKEYLLRAYMLEGYEIFSEEEDQKYYELIKDIIGGY